MCLLKDSQTEPRRVLLAEALYLEQFHFFHINPKRGYAASSRHKKVLSLYKKMGCCAGKLQFHKETKRQDKNEYLAAARAVEHWPRRSSALWYWSAGTTTP